MRIDGGPLQRPCDGTRGVVPAPHARSLPPKVAEPSA